MPAEAHVLLAELPRAVPEAKMKLIQKDMTGYVGQQDENVPLANMDNQLVEMDRDYNVMLMERIESKK